MKITLSTLSMSYLSGAPLYNHSLAIELKRLGHEVTVYSDFTGPLTGASGYRLKQDLELNGVLCVQRGTQLPEQDLFIVSETISDELLLSQPNTPALVVVHSEYEYETPLTDRPQILKYICIRPSIMEHIIREHSIPPEKCVVIYNGVDRNRFQKRNKTKRDYYKVVVPCTLDTLREPFLNLLIDGASKDRRIFFYGFDCGAKLHPSEWVTINPDTFDIQDEIADADEVAGILLGRVNLEAWSCGVDSSIYDPVSLIGKVYPPPKDFDEKHNIRNVASKILKLIKNLDDITVVIPHHDQREKLRWCLESLSGVKHIQIYKGGTFAHNLNKAVPETDIFLFLNDDTVVDIRSTLMGMMTLLDGSDIVGCNLSSGCNGFNLVDGQLEEVVDPSMSVRWPSGAVLMMRADTFKEVGGFDEGFVNGCEDIDFFLRAEKKGKTFGKYTSGVITHNEGSSTGRYDHLNSNIELFNNKWKGVCQIKSVTSLEV